MEEHSKKEFYLEAQKLGFTPEWAVNILRRNGVKGKFDVSQYDKYIKMLRDYAAGLKRMIAVANKQEEKYSLPFDTCPVCGFPIERHSGLDGYYGCKFGWKCTNPVQGSPSHFFIYHLERIKPWMQRNLGMSELEKSSETPEQVSPPSGGSLAETSSLVSSG